MQFKNLNNFLLQNNILRLYTNKKLFRVFNISKNFLLLKTIGGWKGKV